MTQTTTQTGKSMKHLNIEKSEAVKVLVTYDLNKFAAYLVVSSGSSIVFGTSHDWKTLKNNEEFCKYVSLWNLPCEFSNVALRKRKEQLFS